jgi:DNA polymerase I-like protein with 3'-5' exonuclease and polymerase domains
LPLIADIESDGLLNELTKIHCLVLRDTETGRPLIYSSNPRDVHGTVEDGVKDVSRFIKQGELIVGHNLIDFDIPALQKIYPWFHIPESQVVDTLVMSRVMFPDMWDTDKKLTKTKGFPGRLTNKHSLEAWGYRLGCHKGEYQGDTRIEDEAERKRRKWESWNPDMESYCVQDTAVTLKLYQKFLKMEYSQECLKLEHEVKWIISKQEKYGFAFDTQAAAKLYSHLTAEKLRLEQELRSSFTPRYLKDGKVQTPKRDLKNRGYMKDAPFTKVVLTEFAASNRNHIVWWLKQMYRWEPTEFGNDGNPKMDETTLASLKYPEVKALQMYLMVDKRIGQLSTGPEGWLRHERNGRLHGQVNTGGTVTGRASHSKPNMGQVPAVYSPYGKECRALYTASKGRVLMGADQSGVELRCLAHYMARWDKGEYAQIILKGDIHTANQKAAGLPTRDMAKTFIYAFLYGAGNAKIGSIVNKGAQEGGRLKEAFLRKTPALGSLVKAVAAAAKTKGYLVGLDGRHIHVRSAHAALNSLLQSAGAVLAKKSMVIMRELMEKHGLTGRAQQVAWVHDEHQWDCDPEVAEQVGKLQVEAYRLAGEHYNFRIPIDGEFKVGPNWAATH